MLRWCRRAGLLLLAAALAACNASDRRTAEGEEPISALQVQHLSRRYDTALWTAQARASTALLGIALQFCRSEGERPGRASQLRQCHRGGCADAVRSVLARSVGPAGGVSQRVPRRDFCLIRFVGENPRSQENLPRDESAHTSESQKPRPRVSEGVADSEPVV